MSEHEKHEQIGRLATEYSRLKGELNHLEVKLARARASYRNAAEVFPALVVQGGFLVNAGNPGYDVHGVLGLAELIETLTDRDRLSGELEVAATRLRAVAPHLV